MHTRRRLTAALVGGALAVSVLGACGSDDDEQTPDTTVAASTTIAPEDILVSDDAVAAGLQNTVTTLEGLAAAPDTATSEAIDQVTADWFSYEGTIKKNDAAAYLDAEDALALFAKAATDGDSAGLTSAAAKFKTMADAYLAKFPA